MHFGDKKELHCRCEEAERSNQGQEISDFVNFMPAIMWQNNQHHMIEKYEIDVLEKRQCQDVAEEMGGMKIAKNTTANLKMIHKKTQGMMEGVLVVPQSQLRNQKPYGRNRRSKEMGCVEILENNGQKAMRQHSKHRKINPTLKFKKAINECL